MAEQSFTLTGIHCRGCASNIETGLKRVDGVRRVSTDPDTQVVRVRFDEARVDASGVASRLERLGFPVAEEGDV